jgi:hypothetical protein
MKKAQTLQDVRQVTEPTPLDGDTLDEFYVPADPARDPLSPPSLDLRDYLHETPPPLRLLFASHPGSGKSTELNRLMQEAGDDFWFLYFSVRQELDIATLTPVNLILGLMEKLYQVGREEKLIRDERVIEPVRGWLSQIVRETKVMREEELAVDAGVGLDGLLAQVIGMFARLRSAFSLSFESAKTIRQEVEPRIPQLRQYCNLVLAEVSHHLDRRTPPRRLLVIVEDTDKLDVAVARDLFVKHTGLLADLQTSIIYTVPLFLIHSPDRNRLESYFETLTLPMIKTHTPKGERFNDGWDVLRQIVARRLDVEQLIEPQALDMAIEKTGGVLRDLLWALQRASRTARRAAADRISVETMRHSLDQLKNRYSQSVQGEGEVSTEDLYTKMEAIARAPGKAPMDDALQLLLYTQAVIEYNGRGWYDLHPLMREALQEMGRLDVLAH